MSPSLSASSATEISPAALMRDVLLRLGPPGLAETGVVVGPADDDQQQRGVVSLTDAGLPMTDLYTQTVWLRCQIRCVAGNLREADRIGRAVQAYLKDLRRVVGRQASTDERYLIHLANVTAGPSMHYDSQETWETLIFAEVMIGTTPVDPPASD